MSGTTLSIAQLAKRWQTRRERVKHMIESKSLTAFDLTPIGPRRTYRVTLESLRDFESCRTATKKKQARKRLPKTAVKEFF